jgi:hypothetical protein
VPDAPHLQVNDVRNDAVHRLPVSMSLRVIGVLFFLPPVAACGGAANTDLFGGGTPDSSDGASATSTDGGTEPANPDGARLGRHEQGLGHRRRDPGLRFEHRGRQRLRH